MRSPCAGMRTDVVCYRCDLGEHLDCEDRECRCCGPTNGLENEAYEAHGRSATPPDCNCDFCVPASDDAHVSDED